jgi:chromosome transmission fidelity protein 4
MGAEDGTVWQYNLQGGTMENLLVRCALPVRDVAISNDGEWVAVASELVPPIYWNKSLTHL